MSEKTLPPFPWDWVASGTPSGNGLFNAYLVDANGRKIGAIWGKGAEKEAIADFILEACNAAHKTAERSTQDRNVMTGLSSRAERSRD